MDSFEKAAMRVYCQNNRVSEYSEVKDLIESMDWWHDEYIQEANKAQIVEIGSGRSKERYLIIEEYSLPEYLQFYLTGCVAYTSPEAISSYIWWLEPSEVKKIQSAGLSEDALNKTLTSLIGLRWGDFVQSQIPYVSRMLATHDNVEHLVKIKSEGFYVYRLD